MPGGVFREFQPRYAELGIATFPVNGNKQPAVSQYLKMGLPASRKLAEKFASCEGLGLACGPRNKIAVLDIDSPSERLLADALDDFGATPFIVRSASGNHQAWYRHNGEGRSIRPDKSRPIDILGGGYVVAPPSRTAKGAYTIISGGLCDLSSLPAMRRPQVLAAANTESLPIAAEVVREGSRNAALWGMCMRHAPNCGGWEALMEFGMRQNDSFQPALSAEEVLKVVASAWEKERNGENFFGGRKGLVLANDQVDRIMHASPDAFSLFTILKRNHWGRDFVCANAMAEIMPPGGWALRRFQAARKTLEDLGEIILVRKRSPNRPAVYRFKTAQ